MIVMMDINREVFIGSSKEGLKYAEVIRKILDTELARYGLSCTLWRDEGVFILGKTTIENLITKAAEISNSNGYAVMLVTPDDKIEIRGEIKYVPRDNVIFELGLFMGRLGRGHTFCVAPSNVNIKMMSDWAGVTNATYRFYKRPSSNLLPQYLRGCILAIKTAIDKLERPRLENSFNETALLNSTIGTDYTGDVLQEIERNIDLLNQSERK